MSRKYVSLSEAGELDDDRLSAANAIRFYWDTPPTERHIFVDELTYGLEAVNEYQARLCTLLGITVQQETELTMDSGVLVIKEPVLGMGMDARITLHYCYPNVYVPYKLWMKQGETILGIEAYSTQDLIARIHDAYCVMQVFGEGRPLIQ